MVHIRRLGGYNQGLHHRVPGVQKGLFYGASSTLFYCGGEGGDSNLLPSMNRKPLKDFCVPIVGMLAAQHYGRVFPKTDSNDRITTASASPQRNLGKCDPKRRSFLTLRPPKVARSSTEHITEMAR
jgi:hypothetical protein